MPCCRRASAAFARYIRRHSAAFIARRVRPRFSQTLPLMRAFALILHVAIDIAPLTSCHVFVCAMRRLLLYCFLIFAADYYFHISLCRIFSYFDFIHVFITFAADFIADAVRCFISHFRADSFADALRC